MLFILRHYIKDLHADMHGQVYVHAGMPYKFNHYIIMHACFAHNYLEALSHCGHGHDLTSVAQLSVINIANIRSAFNKTLASERFRQNAIAGFYARIYIYMYIYKYTYIYIYIYIYIYHGDCATIGT